MTRFIELFRFLVEQLGNILIQIFDFAKFPYKGCFVDGKPHGGKAANTISSPWKIGRVEPGKERVPLPPSSCLECEHDEIFHNSWPENSDLRRLLCEVFPCGFFTFGRGEAKQQNMLRKGDPKHNLVYLKGDL